MTHLSGESPLTQLVYDGTVLRIEFYVAPNGTTPAEDWLEQLPLSAGFRKGGNKTPKREIDRAETYKKDFEGRMRYEN